MDKVTIDSYTIHNFGKLSKALDALLKAERAVESLKAGITVDLGHKVEIDLGLRYAELESENKRLRADLDVAWAEGRAARDEVAKLRDEMHKLQVHQMFPDTVKKLFENPTLLETCRAHKLKNEKIPVIKLLRMEFGLDLGTAKDFMDAVWDRL